MSKRASYTPGPWQILPEEVSKPYIRIRGTVLGGRYKVANVLDPNYEAAPTREAEETRANARLIAAAPELLEALDLLVSMAESGMPDLNPHDEFVMEVARTAIAKAKGADHERI